MREHIESRMKAYFEVHKHNWEDWRWQLSHSITELSTVESLLDITFDPKERKLMEQTLEKFPLSITPYYLSLIQRDDYANDPIFRQALPSPRELQVQREDLQDPLAEEIDSPVSGVTHRYPDRVLLNVNGTCAMYCRHCTRKRKVGEVDHIPEREELLEGVEYIRRTPAIRDVLLSGGDPFLLPDERLDWILAQISSISHVEVIRIGTRTPVVLPCRITDGLTRILRKYQPIWVNTHFNHPREFTPSSKAAIRKLADGGIPLGNQSVLLAGINDCPRIIKRLVHLLVKNRVRPYYLYQCDLSEGLEHFRTPIGKGIEIMEYLVGHTSGFARPTFVVDAPGGGGKIPLMPNYIISWSGNKVVLRNYEGVITTYQEPANYRTVECNDDCDQCTLPLKLDKAMETQNQGITQLLADYDDTISFTPENNERMKKRDRWGDQES